MVTAAGVATVAAAVVGSDVSRSHRGVMGGLAGLVLAALVVCSKASLAAEPPAPR